jgi:hypothetical protein
MGLKMSATPWRRRVRRINGVPEAALDAPAYDPGIRRRRLWDVGGEQLTMKEVRAKYGDTVANRLYAGDPHPLRSLYERRK